MSMREYSSSGHLLDLRIFDNIRACEVIEEENGTEKAIFDISKEDLKKIKILFGEGMVSDYIEYIEELSEDKYESFYEYLMMLYETDTDRSPSDGAPLDFVYFQSEDNPEEFEHRVLYKFFSKEKLYVPQKETKFMKHLIKLGIEPEFGHYGFWG